MVSELATTLGGLSPNTKQIQNHADAYINHRTRHILPKNRPCRPTAKRPPPPTSHHTYIAMICNSSTNTLH